MTHHIGFWKNTRAQGVEAPAPWSKQYNDLPIENSATAGNATYVQRLKALQRHVVPTQYLGGSYCRICEQYNGSAEYEFVGFVWPSGYMHYLEDHNVACDPVFAAFLMTTNGQ